MVGDLNFITYVCCILSSAVVLALPSTSRVQSRNSGLAIVDCEDANLLQQLLNADISFRCLSDSEQQVINEEAVLNSAYEVSSLKDERTQSKKSPSKIDFIFQNIACVDPERCGSKLTSHDTCPENYVFVAALGVCFPVTSKNFLFSKKFNKFLKNKCKEGYSYESRLGRCVPENKINSFQSDGSETTLNSNLCPSGYEYSPEVDACLSVGGTHACSFGYVYSAEVDACLPAANVYSCPYGYVYSPELNACLLTKNVHTCPTGYVYSPEVDICLPVEYQGTGQSPSSLPLVTEKPESVNQYSTELVGWAKCSTGQVYVSEVDLCVTPEMPSTFNLHQNDTEEDSSVNTSGKKEKRSAYLSLLANQDSGIHFKSETKVGSKKCEKDQVYMSELDICVHNDKYTANNYK